MTPAYNVVLIISALVVLPAVCFAQVKPSAESESKTFANVNLGLGMLNGGFGLSAELGKKHLSTFASFGFANERILDNNAVIHSTFNYHAGIRYYFNVNSNVVFPRIGLGYGWITNYFTSSVPQKDYDQKVEGLSLHIGSQIMAGSGFVFSLDLATTSKWTIAHPDRHPKFFNIYVRPSLSIGYDLERIVIKKKSEKVKNREINPFG